MKKALLLFLTATPLAIAMNMDKELLTTAMNIYVELPSKEVLKDRLNSKKMQHFMEKTNIISELAGQREALIGVVVTIELALSDYFKLFPDTMNISSCLILWRENLFEAFLQDTPDALKQLQLLNFYKKL